MDLQKLITRRERIAAQLKRLDARISRHETANASREYKKLLKAAKAAGVNLSDLNQSEVAVLFRTAAVFKNQGD